MDRLLIFVVQLLLWLFVQIPGSMAGYDGFERAEEITTVRQFLPGPVRMQRIEGRTRNTLLIDKENATSHGQMVDNYCCFWVYQKHPAIPEDWEHRPEYPWDFVVNGIFVKNQRNYTDADSDTDSDTDAVH